MWKGAGSGRLARIATWNSAFVLLLPAALWLPAFLRGQTASLEVTTLNSVTSAPVAGVRVALEGSGKGLEYHAVTNGQGRIEFHGAAPGQYKLTARKNGYVDVLYGARPNDADDDGKPVPLAAGETRAAVELRMIPAAVISGRVMDYLGEPMAGIFLAAERIAYEGRRPKMTIAVRSLNVTNDRGEYRLSGLPPGQFYLSAAGLREIFHFDLFGHGGAADTVEMDDAPPTEALGVQFYPGEPDPARATALNLRAGEERSGVDFRYEYKQLASVRGRLAVPGFCTGKPWFRAEREIVTDQDYPAQAAIGKDGRFELRGLSPGSWRIGAVANDQRTYCSTETAAVLVGQAGADGVLLTLRPRVDLAGAAHMEGDPGFRFEGVKLRLESLEDGDSHSVEIKASGDFKMAVEPRKWLLAVTGAPRNVFLKSARLNETDVLESGLDLTAGPASGRLEIVLSAAGAQIEGVVVNAAGQRAVGATVVLVPEPRLRVHSRLFQEATAGQEGRFSMSGIAPGEYKLFVWDDLDGEAYRDPDFLRGYEERGEKILLRENETNRALPKLIVK
jgi:hypothetical protein